MESAPSIFAAAGAASTAQIAAGVGHCADDRQSRVPLTPYAWL